MTRAELVYKMRLQGLSPSDIAAELGIEVKEVQQHVRRWFKAEAAELSEEERVGILALENARLDHYLAKIWPQIEFGDPKAIMAAVKITETRIKINHLDTPLSTQTNNVLVIGGESHEYIRKLKELAGEEGAA